MPEKTGAKTRLVALLRGINVGRAKRVAMADLRELVEKLGYRDVRTLLNSGNVIFTAPGTAPDKAAARIEKAMTATLGVSARVTVMTAAEIATVVAGNPLLSMADNPSRLFAAVLMDPADRKRLNPLAQQDWSPEALAMGGRVAYVWCPSGIIDSRLFAALSRILGDRVTTRNWATMMKLHALTTN